MEAKEALRAAKEHVTDLFRDEGVTDVGLEELEYRDGDLGVWETTIGFRRAADLHKVVSRAGRHNAALARLSSVAAALESAHGAADSARSDRARRNAAVALVLRPPLGEPDPPLGLCELLTIQRARSPHDPWSGQMALPGGRLDPADGSLVEAAVRETREETGVRLEVPEGVLGRGEPLRPLRPRNPPITVWPFVFRVPSQTTARVASPEVASVHWFALDDLADPANRHSHLWRGGSISRSFPCIRIEGRPIWGLTYRIVTRFMEVALTVGASR